VLSFLSGSRGNNPAFIIPGNGSTIYIDAAVEECRRVFPFARTSCVASVYSAPVKKEEEKVALAI
jgi:hypothetical protein